MSDDFAGLERIRTKNAYSLSIEELAIRQRKTNGLGRETGAVRYARKSDKSEKDLARNAILRMFSRRKFPDGLSILTMPGLHWEFEYRLLALREGGNWRRKKNPAKYTHICAVELDPTIYAASALAIPRKPDSMIVNYANSPRWCTNSVGSNVVRRFHCCDMFSLMEHNEPQFDAVWLDFIGPMTIDRMARVREFWNVRVRRALIITFLAARHDGEIRLISESHGFESWLASELVGSVDHVIRYQDGNSPMIQYAVTRD